MQAFDDDVRMSGDGVTGPRSAPRLPSVTRMIRSCLSSVSAGAVIVRRTIVNLSIRDDPHANPAASGCHQFWGDEE